MQQVGSALGVAIVGVLLFGQLASGADAISTNARPGLERALRTLHLPTPTVTAISSGFAACVHDRFNQRDLNVIPATCSPRVGSLPPAVAQSVNLALVAASTEVRQQNFLAAILVTLRFQLVAYVLCFALVFLLPGKTAPQEVRV